MDRLEITLRHKINHLSHFRVSLAWFAGLLDTKLNRALELHFRGYPVNRSLKFLIFLRAVAESKALGLFSLGPHGPKSQSASSVKPIEWVAGLHHSAGALDNAVVKLHIGVFSLLAAPLLQISLGKRLMPRSEAKAELEHMLPRVCVDMWKVHPSPTCCYCIVHICHTFELQAKNNKKKRHRQFLYST